MGSVLKRNVVLAVAILLAGWALRSVDSLNDVQVASWTLGDLIRWASFSFAGVVAAATAGVVSDAASRPVLQSVAASRLVGAALLGAALWLLDGGARPVLAFSWQPTVEKVVAVTTVLIAAYGVWVVYAGFDDLSVAVRRLLPAASAPSPVGAAQGAAGPGAPSGTALPPPGGVFCGQCGASVPPSDRFCGSCGAPVARRT